MRPIVSLCFVLSLAACSSSSRKSDDSGGSMSMEQRILKTDFNKVSSYEKAFNTAGAGDRGQGSFFGKKSVKGSDFGGLKNFKSGTFHTSEFAQSNKSSNFASKKGRFATKDSSLGNATFKTKTNDFSQEAASRDGTKMFSQGDDTVKTRSFQPGEKSLKQNKRFVFIHEQGSQQEKVAYTEDQVKKLLGR